MSALRRLSVLALLLTAPALTGGCDQDQWQEMQWDAGRAIKKHRSRPAKLRTVPHPIDLLLPETVKLHALTETRRFAGTPGVKGIDARVTALDAYGDITKAFGSFRFELYTFRDNNIDEKRTLLEQWTIDLSDPKQNMRHWQKIPPGYRFRLRWNRAVPAGNRMVLALVFDSPFTERKFDELVFVAGQ